MMRRLLAVLGTLVGLVAQDVGPLPAASNAAGVASYRDGRHAEAHEQFQRALAASGASAPRELRWNAALAALRLQRSGDAEAAVLPLRDSAEADDRADAEFVLALVAQQRGERAVAAAQLPDAEPMAWTLALRALQAAQDGFARADQLRGRWPAAARNAERAARRLAEVQRARDAAPQPPPAQESPPAPVPPPSPRPTPGTTEESAIDLAKDRLAPAEVAQLLQRLQQQEREKRALRQASPRPAATPGERDW